MFFATIAAAGEPIHQPPPSPTGGNASAGASATSNSGQSVTLSPTTNQTINPPHGISAVGGGSTSLTATAPCLGSHSVLFNLFATTYRDKGCLLDQAAMQFCQDQACRLKLKCLDPDLPLEAKAAIGCQQ
jgi:hypothetical protein